jgi:hypothetical protein
MAFIGVKPERKQLFFPEPCRDVPVNDASAWRLNPRHRHVYDKLSLALNSGLKAAPCGVPPQSMGMDPSDIVFVKPIMNLAGMSIKARAMPCDAVPFEAGSFWCERLEGEHTSTDCFVQNGRLIWTAHTRGSIEKDQERCLYWEIGIQLSRDLQVRITHWIEQNLQGYTGICNIEMIGGQPIEAHLRGSNGFFDFYGPHFMKAWVSLVDEKEFTPPPPIPGGLLISVFGDIAIHDEHHVAALALGVQLDVESAANGRAAIIRAQNKEAGLKLLNLIKSKPS